MPAGVLSTRTRKSELGVSFVWRGRGQLLLLSACVRPCGLTLGVHVNPVRKPVWNALVWLVCLLAGAE